MFIPLYYLLFGPNPMLYFFISCFSFIFAKMRLLSPLYWVEITKSLICNTWKRGLVFGVFEGTLLSPMMKVPTINEFVKVDDEEISLLDLPDLALDLILGQLSPAELCSMAGVCSELRVKCRSNRLWEKHMKRKWGRVIGNVALVKWHENMAQNMRKLSLNGNINGGIFGSMLSFWPLSLLIRSKLKHRSEFKVCLPPDSIMSRYLSLENGEFWFPAQVYNREVYTNFFVYVLV